MDFCTNKITGRYYIIGMTILNYQLFVPQHGQKNNVNCIARRILFEYFKYI